MRTYEGAFADSRRWLRFAFRPDDVVITTPSKCGTSWMQTIVAMLVLDSPELDVPISRLSPWLDMRTEREEEVFDRLERQTHRRFIKTHTPLDGIPRADGVTYIAVIRHPLDVALSDLDHAENMSSDRAVALLTEAGGLTDLPSPKADAPDDPAGFLRWFIDNENEPVGSGPYGLADYCQQVRTYWDARSDPGVVLVHYADLWNDLDGEMRRVAQALEVPVDEAGWPAFVRAATLDSMRARADVTAPDAHRGLWRSSGRFFRTGGTREWASLLSRDDLAHFERRLRELAGDAEPWVLHGRAAL